MINIVKSETTFVIIPGNGARVWNLTIGIEAETIEIPIRVNAILVPFLKSIKTSRIQLKEANAEIIPCKEIAGIVKLPIGNIESIFLVTLEIQCKQMIVNTVKKTSNRVFRLDVFKTVLQNTCKY